MVTMISSSLVYMLLCDHVRLYEFKNTHKASTIFLFFFQIVKSMLFCIDVQHQKNKYQKQKTNEKNEKTNKQTYIYETKLC